MMLQVVLLMPVSAKTLKRRRTGSLLSTHVMSAINATLGPQIGSHFLVLYNTCGPVVKVVKVGFLTGFRYVPIHSPNSKTFQLIALNIERYLFTPPKNCMLSSFCVASFSDLSGSDHQQLPSSILSRSDLAAASTCRSCS